MVKIKLLLVLAGTSYPEVTYNMELINLGQHAKSDYDLNYSKMQRCDCNILVLFNTNISCNLWIILNVTQGLVIFSMQMDLDAMHMYASELHLRRFGFDPSTRLRSTLGYDSAALIRDLFHFVNTKAHLGQVGRYLPIQH